MSDSGLPRLHHTEIGDAGPRLVFCHGLFGQGRNWTSIAKALSDTHRSILVDMPNHGRSDWTENFSYQEMARAVAELISEWADSGPVTLIGHSMGGKVSMVLALLHPELVARLVVVDISPVSYGGGTSTGNTDFEDFVQAMRALDLDHLQDRKEADAGMQGLVPSATIRSFLLQNLRRDGDGWRWQMNLPLLGDHLGDLGSWPDLEADPYPGPVLWLAGANSDYVTDDYAAPMRALFPAVRLVTVKNAGHWVHSEQPDVFISAVRLFVDGGPADRS